MLLELTRDGMAEAFGELWSRHSGAVVAAARASTGYDPQDLMQEAFAKVFASIKAGGQLPIAFRAYVATTARRLAVDLSRKDDGTIHNSFEDEADHAAFAEEDFSERVLEDSTTGQAFQELASRHREVLWYRDVEDLPVQEIARYVGMSPNSTTVLIKRARDAFKTAWIKVQLSPGRNLPDECRAAVPKLAAFTRNKLGASERGVIELHLVGCVHCAALASEADELHKKLALVLLPLLLLGGAPGYLAWIQRGDNRTPPPAAATYANVALSGIRRSPGGLHRFTAGDRSKTAVAVAAALVAALMVGAGAGTAFRTADVEHVIVAQAPVAHAPLSEETQRVPAQKKGVSAAGEHTSSHDDGENPVGLSGNTTERSPARGTPAYPVVETSGVAPGMPAADPLIGNELGLEPAPGPEPAPAPEPGSEPEAVVFHEPRELQKYPTESPYTIRFTATVGSRVTLEITAPGFASLTVVSIADADGNVFYDFPSHRGATVRVTITQEWESETGPQIDQLPGILWDHFVPV